MKRILFFLLVLLLPFSVSAGNSSDDVVSEYQLEIPTYTNTYVTDYYDTYTCKYRLNLIEIAGADSTCLPN